MERHGLLRDDGRLLATKIGFAARSAAEPQPSVPSLTSPQASYDDEEDEGFNEDHEDPKQDDDEANLDSENTPRADLKRAAEDDQEIEALPPKKPRLRLLPPKKAGLRRIYVEPRTVKTQRHRLVRYLYKTLPENVENPYFDYDSCQLTYLARDIAVTDWDKLTVHWRRKMRCYPTTFNITYTVEIAKWDLVERILDLASEHAMLSEIVGEDYRLRWAESGVVKQIAPYATPVLRSLVRWSERNLGSGKQPIALCHERRDGAAAAEVFRFIRAVLNEPGELVNAEVKHFAASQGYAED